MKGALHYLETDKSRVEAHIARRVERVLSLISTLGLSCLCIGLVLHIVGKAVNNFLVVQVGAYILLVGGLLVTVRLIEWIAEKMVERGLESIAKEE